MTLLSTYKIPLLKGYSTGSFYIEDTSENSPNYFDAQDFPLVVGGGRHVIKIKGGLDLRINTTIDIEIIDAEGQAIFTEVTGYTDRFNNYYISFDTNGDDIPDTTLVYNSNTKARTQYIYPNTYDYWFYITSTWEYKYLIASATEDRLYEIESWFDDLGETIDHHIKSKDFDFWEPWTFKTYEYIDLIGKKSKNLDIEVNIEVDWVVIGWWLITDNMITETKPSETLWVNPIGIETLTWSLDDEDWVDIYSYVARIPFYSTGSTINFEMKSSGWSWTIDSARIMVNSQSIEVFRYANIV